MQIIGFWVQRHTPTLCSQGGSHRSGPHAASPLLKWERSITELKRTRWFCRGTDMKEVLRGKVTEIHRVSLEWPFIGIDRDTLLCYSKENETSRASLLKREHLERNHSDVSLWHILMKRLCCDAKLKHKRRFLSSRNLKKRAVSVKATRYPAEEKEIFHFRRSHLFKFL